MRLLDLFCGAGGAATGYARAGFDVVGVDFKPQKRYPYEFHQSDALAVLDTLLAGQTWQGYRLSDFAAIHASPPCQAYSRANHIRGKAYPMLLGATREYLQATGLPWVMENVSGAPMGHFVKLCGTHFGLKVYRHRQFESNILLFAPGPCSHPYKLLPGYVCIYGDEVRGTAQGRTGNHYHSMSVEYGRVAMGISWMTQKELSQAIPPAYTEYLGQQLLNILEREVA